MDAELKKDDYFSAKGVVLPQGWKLDPEKPHIAHHEKGNFAVAGVESPDKPVLELLTKQPGDQAAEWKPSKTPFQGPPEAVFREAAYREGRIGKSWSLDGETGLLLHKGGTFAAREIEGSRGRLELLTKHKDKETGKMEWTRAGKPCEGSPEAVFREAGKRQWLLEQIKAGKALPPNYTVSKATPGVGIHPNKRFAVRKLPDGQNLEILTSQFSEKTKNWEWREAKTPFQGPPEAAYREIERREYGLQKGKEEAAAGKTAEKPAPAADAKAPEKEKAKEAAKPAKAEKKKPEKAKQLAKPKQPRKAKGREM